MIKTETFCDICGGKFQAVPSYWDSAPCRVEIKMGSPAQAYESYVLEHVCKGCRESIHRAIDNLRVATNEPEVQK